METSKHLVNPIALADCTVRNNALSVNLLDLSYLRLVVEEVPEWGPLTEPGSLDVQLVLERYQFNVATSVQARGEGWMRLSLDKVLPSAQASLRSFLSPKKIGESLLEDWRTEEARHFHGLNESELWFNVNGGLLFSYLCQGNADLQFVIHGKDRRSALHVGTMPRQQYIELSGVDSDLPLEPLEQREVYRQVGQCRDVITNFRPVGQIEFHLKQRLLQLISDYLYSTGRSPDLSAARSSATHGWDRT